LAAVGIWRMLVIDPDLIAHDVASAFVDSVACSAAPLIVYTSLTRTSARTIATLARRSLAAVLFRGVDDSLSSLRSILDPAPVGPLGGSMIELLAGELDQLPPAVRRGTIAAFCASAPVNSPKALAALSGQSRRSIDRWFTRVGLKPAKSVLATSQLIRAYSSLEDGSLSLASVALISGFGSARALSHNSLALTGIPIRALRGSIPPLGLLAYLSAEIRSSTH
jgi:AraC-like DNA-binding protein